MVLLPTNFHCFGMVAIWESIIVKHIPCLTDSAAPSGAMMSVLTLFIYWQYSKRLAFIYFFPKNAPRRVTVDMMVVALSIT